jgi:hypothetical protein
MDLRSNSYCSCEYNGSYKKKQKYEAVDSFAYLRYKSINRDSLVHARHGHVVPHFRFDSVDGIDDASSMTIIGGGIPSRLARPVVEDGGPWKRDERLFRTSKCTSISPWYRLLQHNQASRGTQRCLSRRRYIDSFMARYWYTVHFILCVIEVWSGQPNSRLNQFTPR